MADRRGRPHRGYDVFGRGPVYAVARGRVVKVVTAPGSSVQAVRAGSYVDVHSSAAVFRYLHIVPSVAVGDIVGAGSVLGVVDPVFGHVHFETRSRSGPLLGDGYGPILEEVQYGVATW